MAMKPFSDNFNDYLQSNKDDFKDIENRSFSEQELVRSAAERDPRQYRGIGYGGLTGEEKEAVEAAGMSLPQNLVARENLQQRYSRTGQAKGFGFDEAVTPLAESSQAQRRHSMGEYDDAPFGAGDGGGAPTGPGIGIEGLSTIAKGFALSTVSQNPFSFINSVISTMISGDQMSDIPDHAIENAVRRAYFGSPVGDEGVSIGGTTGSGPQGSGEGGGPSGGPAGSGSGSGGGVGPGEGSGGPAA